MSTKATPRISNRSADRYRGYSDLSIVYEGSSENIPVHVPDVSTTGMFINTSRHFPEGAVIKVRFRLVRSNLEITARAEVRYCLTGVGIGVQFVDISAEDQAAIEQELQISKLP
ncbi:MAG: hypothetical protein JWO13_1451 [Acidobacteriales bacterium]|nr:hypothetical protein [Terriglobales bacterium]